MYSMYVLQIRWNDQGLTEFFTKVGERNGHSIYHFLQADSTLTKHFLTDVSKVLTYKMSEDVNLQLLP